MEGKEGKNGEMKFGWLRFMQEIPQDGKAKHTEPKNPSAPSSPQKSNPKEREEKFKLIPKGGKKRRGVGTE